MRSPLFTPLLAVLIGAPVAAQTPPQPPELIASLRGTMEVPPIATHATGMAKLTLMGSEVRYEVTVDDLRDITGVFLHIGGPGQSKPAVATLFQGAKAGPVNGTLVTGTLRPQAVHGATMSKLLRALRADDTYLSVTTRRHPDGELRGELRLQSHTIGG